MQAGEKASKPPMAMLDAEGRSDVTNVFATLPLGKEDFRQHSLIWNKVVPLLEVWRMCLTLTIRICCTSPIADPVLIQHPF